MDRNEELMDHQFRATCSALPSEKKWASTPPSTECRLQCVTLANNFNCQSRRARCASSKRCTTVHLRMLPLRQRRLRRRRCSLFRSRITTQCTRLLRSSTIITNRLRSTSTTSHQSTDSTPLRTISKTSTSSSLSRLTRRTVPCLLRRSTSHPFSCLPIHLP